MHWYNYCCIKYKLNKFQLFIKSKWLNDGILLVFSTYVEVILSDYQNPLQVSCFLHVCGGDPDQLATFIEHLWFSPRMWR